ncbi:hypothetical protein B0H13DRAFT_2656179 [Mycena leptocephala]|nr:hypothetical protein B0H13DRAFT_2656179 [Mycena leptocephala]
MDQQLSDGGNVLGANRFQDLMATNTAPSNEEATEILQLINSNTAEIHEFEKKITALAMSNRSLAEILSVTRTIPFDILAEIFGLTVKMTGNPWVLALICRRWRGIALDASNLWSVIDLDQTARNPKLRPAEYPLEKLQASLDRSANHPLDIRFCTVPARQDPSHAHSLLATLVGCSQRWRSLFIEAENRVLSLLVPVKGNVPILESLMLHISITRRVFDAFEIAPRLNTLDISGTAELTPICPLVLPWSQITHFNGDFAIWQDHIDTFELLPNLVECRSTMINWASNEHEGVIVLPRLRRLYVMHGDFLEFKAPSLVELVVEPIRMKPFPNVFANLAELIHLSACQLTKLCLIAVLTAEHDNDKLISTLTSLPSLVELCIQSRARNEMRTLDALASALVPTTPCLLPRLEELTIGGYRFNDLGGLLDMVSARWHADPAVCSTLRVLGLFHVLRLFLFDDDEILRLDMLQREGFDVRTVTGAEARAAMLSVPFFHAGLSDGQYWSPEAQSI